MPLFDFGTNKPFSTQFGSELNYIPTSTNPVNNQKEEEEDDEPTKDNQQTDIAGIITASALGVDSITNAISAFTGKGGTTTDTPTYNPDEDPPTKKSPSPLLVVVVLVGVVGLIGLLAMARRKASPVITSPT